MFRFPVVLLFSLTVLTACSDSAQREPSASIGDIHDASPFPFDENSLRQDGRVEDATPVPGLKDLPPLPDIQDVAEPLPDALPDVPPDLLPETKPELPTPLDLVEASPEVDATVELDTVDLVEPDVCIPLCEGKECGPDGCGGGCGSCPCPGCMPEELVCDTSALCVPEQGLSCEEVYNCVNGCAYNDQNCYQGCQSQGSPFAQAAFTNFMTCLQQVGYADCAALPPSQQTDCYVAKQALCEDQVIQCFHGELTCQEMWMCIIQCQDWDAPCQSACLDEGSVDAQYVWNDFANCMSDLGYWACGQEDTACKKTAWEGCESTFNQCVAGTGQCSDILACLDFCAPWELSCQSGCIYVGTVEAQATYDAILDCVDETCGPNPTWQCSDNAIVDECQPEFLECLND